MGLPDPPLVVVGVLVPPVVVTGVLDTIVDMVGVVVPPVTVVDMVVPTGVVLVPPVVGVLDKLVAVVGLGGVVEGFPKMKICIRFIGAL